MPFGSSRLIQTDDFFQTGLGLVAGPIGRTGDQALTGCTGAETMKDLTQGQAANGAYAEGSWSDPGTRKTRTQLTESVSRAVTEKITANHVQELLDRLLGCEYREGGINHTLGQPTARKQHGGTATYYVSTNADGTGYGGVMVLQSGRNFGVAEIIYPRVDVSGIPDLMTSLTAAGLFRIKDPG